MGRPRAAQSFATSLFVHSSIIAILWGADPRFPLRSYPEPTVEELIAKADRRVVWYPVDALLPKVTPEEPVTTYSTANRPRFKLPQPVTANERNAQSDRQKIIAESPEIEIQTDQALPNMLSWETPAVQQPRFQRTTPKLVAPTRQALRTITAEAPKPVSQQPDDSRDWSLDSNMFKKLSRLRYQRNQPEQQTPEQQTLNAEAAPEINPTSQPRLDPSQFQQLSRLRYQSREAARPDAPDTEALSAADAPIVTATAPTQPGLDPSQYQQLSRLRYQSGGGGRESC